MNSLPIDHHWNHYSRQWSDLGPPLRPSAEDLAFTRSAIAEWLRTTRRAARTQLILGVTPELCGLPIDLGSRVIAVDRSVEMIWKLWLPRPNADEVICADWRRMPLGASSIDLVLGDGCLPALNFPLGHSALFHELRRILRPEGRCIIRCFVQADERETPDEVFADLSRERIGSFHALKLRLAMALQSDVKTGIALESVYNLVQRTWPKLNLLAERFGWSIGEVLTIEAYRSVKIRYAFPTCAQYCSFFSAAGFSVRRVVSPSYELGERCPTFVLELPTAAPRAIPTSSC
jgi:SAM-dependent methyltransferase